MCKIDVNERRAIEINMHQLSGADCIFTIYYDETNNIRRFYVTEEGFNDKQLLPFVLGGVAHIGPPRVLDFFGLRRALKLQPSVKELKLKHLGKGDALALLASPKVETFLDWVGDQDLVPHYSVIDPLFWSTIEIIDSVVAIEQMAHLGRFHANLKADLFTILFQHPDDMADLFHRYSYPNVGDLRVAFIDELLDRLSDREEVLPHFNYQMLRGALQAGKRDEGLIFLEDEVPSTLLDSFLEFYIHRFCLLKNAQHILDNEPTIQERLQGVSLLDEGRPFCNYEFVESSSEAGVQVADAMVGLLGKLFSYFARTSHARVVAGRKELSSHQLRVIGKINALCDKSQAVCPAFLHTLMSVDAMQAGQVFLGGNEFPHWRLA